MGTVKRTWSIEEKIAILKDIEKTGVVEGCRKHGIYATTYYDLSADRQVGRKSMKKKERRDWFRVMAEKNPAN
jgi:transposase-like protein